jgi:hypothetical protein
MQATTLDDTLVEVTTARFALTLMSACGTKQTCSMRWQMSAFGGKADSDQPLLTDPDL